MNILLHVCCGPCAIYPVISLRQSGHQPYGYFFNPNIHPFKEFQRRIEALEAMSQHYDFHVDYERDYGLVDYLRQVVFHEQERCRICYSIRLRKTAEKAVELGLDGFSTTLLYSKYQNHTEIKQQAELFAEEYKVHFHYADFRPGWQYGIDQALDLNLYRQPYCGCIYSEQDRYDRNKSKAAGK